MSDVSASNEPVEQSAGEALSDELTPLERALGAGRAAAELLRAFTQAAAVPVVICRAADTEILHGNARLGELTGVNPEQLVGRRLVELCQAPADALGELAQRGRVRERELCLMGARPAPVWVALSLEPVSLPRTDDGERGWTTRGGLLLGTLRDLTRGRELEGAREELERANLNLCGARRQLARAEKMASLGLLMAGIAHEIRTPLGAVNSTQRTLSQALDKLTERLGEAFPETLADSKLGRLLKVLADSARVVGDGSRRMTDIVQRLRDFSCADEAKLCSVDVNAIADDTLALVHHELKHYVAIQRCYGEGVTLMGYPARLNQVLVNLLINAAQAVRARGNGKIKLETRALGDHIEISVSDDGVGIPPENLKQIFSCGFTTRQEEGGSGLGLAISKEIVDAHHGSLEVESKVGAGTTFTVRLPRTLSDCRKPPRGCRF